MRGGDEEDSGSLLIKAPGTGRSVSASVSRPPLELPSLSEPEIEEQRPGTSTCSGKGDFCTYITIISLKTL